VRRFSESFGEEAGAHFTSRDIIYLMTDLLLCDADLTRGGNVTVYEKTLSALIQINDSAKKMKKTKPLVKQFIFQS
jgi:type I restriction-modification system DNA methylase subunit